MTEDEQKFLDLFKRLKTTLGYSPEGIGYNDLLVALLDKIDELKEDTHANTGRAVEIN